MRPPGPRPSRASSTWTPRDGVDDMAGDTITRRGRRCRHRLSPVAPTGIESQPRPGAAMRKPFVAAVLLAIACTSTARAARPSYRYELVVQTPGQLEDVLRQRLAYGYACAAVARPVGMKLAINAAVVVGLETGADVPLKRDVRVITVTP